MTDRINNSEAGRLRRLLDLALVAWVLIVHIFFLRQYFVQHWDAILALIRRFIG